MPKQKLYEDELTEALSVIFRERRMLLLLSQAAVAYKTGMSRPYIGDLERTGRNISLLNLSRMAEALHSTPSKLMVEAERLVKEKRRRR